jgi:hypothetical protein
VSRVGDSLTESGDLGEDFVSGFRPNKRFGRPVRGELLNSCGISSISRPRYNCAVRDLAVLFLHRLATDARLAGPGGARAVVAESVLVKHQLLILNRSRKRRPISVPLIAWSPVCVRSSCARVG